MHSRYRQQYEVFRSWSEEMIPTVENQIACLHPDGWNFGEALYFDERSAKGFQLRVKTGHSYGITSLAVKIQITGKARYRSGHRALNPWYRCKIIFQGDCEPDIVHHGWISYSLPWR